MAYDYNKRASIDTVGELLEELKNLPADTPIHVCGEPGGWLHVEEESLFINIDSDDLSQEYEDGYDEGIPSDDFIVKA